MSWIKMNIERWAGKLRKPNRSDLKAHSYPSNLLKFHNSGWRDCNFRIHFWRWKQGHRNPGSRREANRCCISRAWDCWAKFSWRAFQIWCAWVRSITWARISWAWGFERWCKGRWSLSNWPAADLCRATLHMQDLALKPWQIHRQTFDEKSKPEHSIYFSGAAVVPSIKPSSCWLRTRGSEAGAPREWNGCRLVW